MPARAGSPDLFIIGGGLSKDHQRYIDRFTPRAPVVPAQRFNDAGIVGGAIAGHIA